MYVLNSRGLVNALVASLLIFLMTNLSFARQATTIAQANSDLNSINSTVTEFIDSSASISPVINPGKKNPAIVRMETFYQQWEDQFPAALVQHSYGSAPERLREIPRKQQREDWKFYLTFSLLVLLALIRFGYSREFDELSTTFNNWGPSQQMFRELGTGVSFGTVLLNFFSVLVISMFAYLLLTRYTGLNVDPPWILMVIATAAVALFLFARYLLLKAASLLLPFRKEITLYNFYEIQMNRVLGVALFPLIMLVTFSPAPLNVYALYAALLVLAGCILMRYMKGFNIGINYFGRHLFHFLLYICALEIAPVLIIIRLLQNLGPLRFSF
ncbi:MAG: DUF4271 domain-containing protein [Chitinophagales bacterium]